MVEAIPYSLAERLLITVRNARKYENLETHDADEENLHVRSIRLDRVALDVLTGVLHRVSARSKRMLTDKTCSGLFPIAALYC